MYNSFLISHNIISELGKCKTLDDLEKTKYNFSVSINELFQLNNLNGFQYTQLKHVVDKYYKINKRRIEDAKR